MAAIATCPHCAKQLGLPESYNPLDHAECPECHATFSLSKAVQISLPVAKLAPPTKPDPIPPTEPGPVTAVVETRVELDSPAEDTGLVSEESEPTAQQSWEDRLKKVLALDSEAEEQAVETVVDTPAQETSVVEAADVTSPSFEFQLDPAPTESPAPAKRSNAPMRTLADFAAEAVESAPESTAPVQSMVTAEVPELEHTKPPADSFETPRLQIETPLSRRKKTVASPRKQVSPVVTSPVVTPQVEVAKSPTREKLATRKRFSKLAAFAVGPIAGSLLGLYGLLWVQGDQADYVGLSKVLPSSILPASFGQADDALELAEPASPIQKLLAKKSAPERIMHDDSVALASATQPLSKPRISASEYIKLVNDAQDALPGFVAGDLTTPESTRRKGQAYIALCQLAENYDYGKQPGLSPTVYSKVKEAATIFIDSSNQDHVLRDLAHIAGRWWEYEQRPSSGIFLAGQVHQIEATDRGTLCWVRLTDSPDAVTIPVWSNAGHFRTGDRMGVVGRVVSTPRGLPQGFKGNRVVSMSHGFSL